MSSLHRFWVLTGLRWLPTGLVIPVLTLLPLERGLSLQQLGSVFAVQGVVVLLLELPTGGFADAAGRRPVVLASAVMALSSYVAFALAPDAMWFAIAVGLTGVFRALDSGPLNAWFVDRVNAGPHAVDDVARGLSGASAIIGGSIATGSLLSAALIAWAPVDRSLALALPYWAAAALAAVQIVVTVVLMVEHRPADAHGMLASMMDTPRTVMQGARLLTRSRVLTALLAVELFWGFGMVGFEVFMPARLSELLAGRSQAAAVMGPVSAAAWGVSALGALAAPALARRWGSVPVSVGLRLVQGATVVAMGLAFGPVGLVIAYLLTYAVHSASGVLYETLLHEQVESKNRATVLSLASMVMQPAGSLGAIVLGAVAAGRTTGAALVLAGIVLALAAPLFLVRPRSGDERHDVGDGVVDRGRAERKTLDGRGGSRAAEDQEGAQTGLES